MNTYLRGVLEELALPPERMVEIARSFRQAMEQGLQRQDSCLKMLPSFIGPPTGREEGTFLTVDMGGSNLRCARFRIGDGRFENQKEIKQKLVDPDGAYNLVSSQATAEQLFDAIAEGLSCLVEPGESYSLGNTFSFPCHQSGINQARLIHWTKEIATQGVEGQDINQLLAAALQRRGLPVTPVAVLNDTVGTLLVAGYRYPHADIGSIMGTGHNACYIQHSHPATGKDMLVNMESGNFDVGLPMTAYDQAIDRGSQLPGSQLLEKMVAGRYIGSLVQQMLLDLCEHQVLFQGRAPQALFNGVSALMVERFILYPGETVALFHCAEEEAELIRLVSQAVLRRNVRLIVSTFLGVLFHQEQSEQPEQEHVIAIDGTIYEKMPGAPALMREALDEVLGEAGRKVTTELVKDGSGLGAAIAAAVAVQQE